MLVEVTKEKVKLVEGGHINAGELNVNVCSFSLPICFDGLNVTACFNNIPVPLLNGKCILPALKQGTATLGVYAYKNSENGLEIVYSPEPTYFCVHKGSFTEDSAEAPSFDISEYEQYCNMIKGEYKALEAVIKEAEQCRNEAEAKRQLQFENGEQRRQAEYEGSYTNLLKGFVEDSTAALPAQLPCYKKGFWYNKDAKCFTANAGFDCYLFKVSPGDRILVSGYVTTSAMGGMACVLDENYMNLQYFSHSSSFNLLGGMYVMPEEARYVALNTPSTSPAPNVSLVSENIIKSGCVDIPSARKFISPQLQGDYHLRYGGQAGGVLTANWSLDKQNRAYANGIYPLEGGVEYVLYIPGLLANEQYYNLAFLCDENFNVNRVVQQASADSKIDFDKHNRLVFTPTENDKYIAINTYDFAPAQFGENKPKGISMAVNVGNTVFDGLHDITLKDMGVVDRMLFDKKWVSYGDSITLGADGDNNGFGIVENGWQNCIMQRYGIDNHINMGVGFSTLAMKESYAETPMSHDARLNKLIDESPHIVTILAGANDYILNVPVGTAEDVANKNRYTFKGAYAYIIDKILTSKPDTIILLLGMFCNTMGNYAEGKGAYPLKEYARATKEIAEHFGLPFIDLNECGFNEYNFNTANGIFSKDGIHPNKEGVKRIAMVVSRWFDAFKGTAL